MAGEQPRSAAWTWIMRPDWHDSPRVFCLTLVRGAEPEDVIRGFGGDPESARELTEEEMLEEFEDEPSSDDRSLRVGRAGEWAFALEDWDIQGSHGVAALLSAATEAVAVNYISEKGMGYLEYFVDGVVVTGFEPLGAFDRVGREPDRFVTEMRQAGLDVDGDLELDYAVFDPTIAALDMLTLALGIRLPEEVATGPLLTITPHPCFDERSG
jgi:hypothetical protein